MNKIAMNRLAIFCQLLVIVAANPETDGRYENCFELEKVKSDYFNPIPNGVKKYICYDNPMNDDDYNIFYENPNSVNPVHDKYVNCLSFKKAQFKVIFLHEKKLLAFIKKKDNWKRIDFEFDEPAGADTIYDLTEVRKNQTAFEENQSISLRQLAGEGDSEYLTSGFNPVKIYSESFDPEPDNFDGEIITTMIVRSPKDDFTNFVLSKGDFWISEVVDKYVTLFIENYKNSPYVFTFVDNSTAKAYREFIIDWVNEDKQNVPFPENILKLLLSNLVFFHKLIF